MGCEQQKVTMQKWFDMRRSFFTKERLKLDEIVAKEMDKEDAKFLDSEDQEDELQNRVSIYNYLLKSEVQRIVRGTKPITNLNKTPIEKKPKDKKEIYGGAVMDFLKHQICQNQAKIEGASTAAATTTSSNI